MTGTGASCARNLFYILLFCGLLKPHIQIPGAEVAGQVEAIGQNGKLLFRTGGLPIRNHLDSIGCVNDCDGN